MAQTEDMKRLLKDGKIVGKLWFVDGSILQSQWEPTFWTKLETCITECHVIRFDSFEQGIRVGDEWWFEGDLIKINCPPYNGEIVELSITIYGTPSIRDKGFPFMYLDSFMPEVIEYSGNIHEKEQS